MLIDMSYSVLHMSFLNYGVETLPGCPFCTLSWQLVEMRTEHFSTRFWLWTQNTTSTQSREMVVIAAYHESTTQNRWLPSDSKRSYCGIISKEEWSCSMIDWRCDRWGYNKKSNKAASFKQCFGSANPNAKSLCWWWQWHTYYIGKLFAP